MKKIICVIISMTSLFVFAQSLQHEDKLVEYLGLEKFNEIKEVNPNYLVFLDTRCTYGYKLIELNNEKTVSMDVIDDAVVVDYQAKLNKDKIVVSAADIVLEIENSTFNILRYQLKYDKSQIVYYVLGETGKVLMIYPVEYINNKMNSSN